MCFNLKLIDASSFDDACLYVLVIFSFSNLLYSSRRISQISLVLSANTSRLADSLIFLMSICCFWKLFIFVLNFIKFTKLQRSFSNGSEIGKKRKRILKAINNDLLAKLNINQWRDTSQVIDWLQKLECKSKSKFIQVDVKEFYPSITEEALDKAISFAFNCFKSYCS